MKLINDAFGHHVGDEVLRTIADRLVQTASPEAVVARFGGDEFVILDGTLTRAEGRQLAQAIRAVIDAPLNVGTSGSGLQCPSASSASPATRPTVL